MMKQSFKEYFSFTASERNTVFIIAILIMLIILFQVFQPDNHGNNSESLKITLLQLDKEFSKDEEKKNRYDYGIKEENLALFNPNVLTDSQWLNLGLKPYQIENIRNYIGKIGDFQNKEDFKSLYTLSDKQYEKLEPYLNLEKSSPVAKQTHSTTGNDAPIHQFIDKPVRKKLWFEINSAGIADLELLPGIGPVYSKRIKKYQDLLGGFVNLNQLTEVYGLDSSIIEKAKPFLWIDSSAVKKIIVNEATEVELFKHPYLKPYEARAIVAFREYKKIDSLELLVKENIISVATFSKIRPYLQ